jgi:nitrogen regulatory protein P-II 1
VKLITAIVRAGELDDVTRAVVNAGARGMTVTEVRGFGQQYGDLPEARPTERATTLLLPKLRVDVVIQDRDAAAVVDAIAKSVRTGAIGDGKIWVCPADGALRVRTGERDDDAV